MKVEAIITGSVVVMLVLVAFVWLTPTDDSILCHNRWNNLQKIAVLIISAREEYPAVTNLSGLATVYPSINDTLVKVSTNKIPTLLDYTEGESDVVVRENPSSFAKLTGPPFYECIFDAANQKFAIRKQSSR